MLKTSISYSNENCLFKFYIAVSGHNINSQWFHYNGQKWVLDFDVSEVRQLQNISNI